LDGWLAGSYNTRPCYCEGCSFERGNTRLSKLHKATGNIETNPAEQLQINPLSATSIQYGKILIWIQSPPGWSQYTDTHAFCTVTISGILSDADTGQRQVWVTNRRCVGQQRRIQEGFEVLTAVSTKTAVFWVVARRSLAEVYHRHEGWMMQAAMASETSVNVDHTTRRYNPEDNRLLKNVDYFFTG
jgi:hypothetical protein